MKNKRTKITVSLLSIAASLTLSLPQASAEDFVIGLYWPPDWSLTNATQYDYIRDANINMVLNTNNTDINTKSKNDTVLGLAGPRNIKYTVADSRIENVDSALNSEIDTKVSPCRKLGIRERAGMRCSLLFDQA